MLLTKLKIAAAVALGVTLLAGTGVGLTVALAGPAGVVFPPAKPVVGWLKIEFRPPTSGAAVQVTTYDEPSTGRRVQLRPDGRTVDQFDDPVAGVSGRSYAAVGRFAVGTEEAHARSAAPMMLTEPAVLAELGPADAVRATAGPVTGNDRVTDVVVDPSKNLPATPFAKLQLHADADTGLLRRVVDVSPGPGKPADVITITPVAGPPVDLNKPESLPLPPGLTLLDDRPSPEAADLLKKLRDVVDRGLGVPAYAVVTRLTDPHTGEFDPDLDEVTVEAGDVHRFVTATWRLGKSDGLGLETQVAPRPAGWPTPTFLQVIDAVDGHRPNRFAVCDGAHAWVIDSVQQDQPRPPEGRRELADPAEYWRTASVVGRLWGACDAAGVLTHYAVGPAPGDPNGDVLLRADTDIALTDKDGKTALTPARSVRLTVAPTLGPLPVRVETQNLLFTSRGLSRDVTDVGPAAWTFRDPVRVPQHWRRLPLTESDPPFVEYHTLVPAAGGDAVPAAWFDDPATHWPR